MLKTKFKQTEIGLIPEDWEVRVFTDIFDFYSTASYSRADMSNSGDVGYIHYGDIHTRIGNHLDTDKYVSGFISKKQAGSYTFIEQGDLIMADASEDYSGVGKSFEVLNKPKLDTISGLHTFLIREKKESFSLGFKGYLHSNPIIKKQYDSLATGLKVYSLSKKIFNNIQIPLPSLPEQEAIAEALSDSDAWIESLEKLIAKKRLIKQGAMQELLTPKEDWEVKKLGEVAACLDNFRKPLNDNQRRIMKGDIPYCGANGIVDYINNYLIDDDIILLAEDGGYFDEYKTRPIAYRMIGKCWVNNHAHILKSKEINQIFLFYSLVHKNITDYITGGTRAKLNKSVLLIIKIAFPKLHEEQIRIATILSDMDTEIEALEQKLSKARQIKQGMMQELLTGRTRLV